MTIITNLPNKNSCGFNGLAKIAKIIPILKTEQDDRTVFSYYRPISLLPIVSKVVEKVISDQINELFVKHKLLFDHQNDYNFWAQYRTCCT